MVSKEQQFAQNFPDEDLLTEEPVIDDWQDEISTKPQEVEILDWQDEQPKLSEKPQPNISRLESGARGAYDTATSGFGDEIQAAGAAPVGALYESYTTPQEAPKLDNYADAFNIDKMAQSDIVRGVADNYDAALANTREREQQAQQQNPISYGTGQAAGALGQAYKLAGTKAATTLGGAIDRGLLSSTTKAEKLANGATKAITSGLTGAASLRAYNFGSGEGGAAERAENSGKDDVLGLLVGGAAPSVAKAVGSSVKGAKTIVKGMGAKEGETLQATASSMKSDAGAIRGQMKDLGAEFKPETTGKLVNNVDQALQGVELIPEFNPKTIAVVREIKASAGKGELNLDKLDQYRRLLRGAHDEDSVAAGAVRRAIDNTVNSLSGDDFAKGGTQAVNLLNKFRADYTKASKFEDITDILAKADGDPNKIKSGLSRFALDKDNTRGWNAEEISALREAAKSSSTEKLLKMAGKFGIDLGSSFTPGNTIGPIIGGAINPAYPVAGTIAKQGQKYLARGKAEELLKVIEQGGKPSIKEINALSPKDAQTVLQKLKSAGKNSSIVNLNDRIRK